MCGPAEKVEGHPTLPPMQASRGDPGLRAAAALLAWLAGTALQLQQSALWPQSVNVALVCVALPIALLAWRGTWRSSIALWCIALAALAFGSTSLRAGHRLAQQLAPPLEG